MGEREPFQNKGLGAGLQDCWVRSVRPWSFPLRAALTSPWFRLHFGLRAEAQTPKGSKSLPWDPSKGFPSHSAQLCIRRCVSGANRMGLEHLGVVDNKGIAEPILKCFPISGHTAANGTGQMPLAEKVTWVETKASLHLGLQQVLPRGRGTQELGDEKQSSGWRNSSFAVRHLTVATQDTQDIRYLGWRKGRGLGENGKEDSEVLRGFAAPQDPCGLACLSCVCLLHTPTFPATAD